MPLEGNRGLSEGKAYSHYVIFGGAMDFIRENKGRPFFCYPPDDIDGISILPTLIGEKAAGRPQRRHAYLYWEINGWTAIRQGNWRAVQPKGKGKAEAVWELYDLAVDPGEARDLAANQPDVLEKLKALAAGAHQPVVEGTSARTDRHERDRRAKFGKQDDPGFKATAGGGNTKGPGR